MKHFLEPYLDRVDLTYDSFYNLENNTNRYWRWSEGNSTVTLVNMQSSQREVAFIFVLKKPKFISSIEITVSYSGKEEIYILDNTKSEIDVKLKLLLKKGKNTIMLQSPTKKRGDRDPRELSFGIFDYQINFLDYQKKNVIVHAGTEKTGTTSLQKFFFEYKNKMINDGVYYLNMHHINHWFLVTYCIDEEKNTDMVYRNNLHTISKRKYFKKVFHSYITQQIESIGKDITTVIISSEHFHSNINTLTEIQNVKEFLDAFFKDKKILFYLRRQDQVALSRYSTRIKSGEYSLEVFPKKPDSTYYDYFKILSQWVQIFKKENLIVKIYEENKLYKKNIIDDFLKITGVNNTVKKNNYKLNQSLSLTESMVLLFINKQINKECEWFKNKNIFSRDLIAYFVDNFKMNDEKKLMPSKKEAELFYDYFKDANSKLSKEFFYGKEFFSNDFSMYPDKNNIKINLNRNKKIEKVILTFINFLKTKSIIKGECYD